jgi:hypothetical protein
VTNPETHESGGAIRPLLWLLLVISIAANAVINSAGVSIFLAVATGLITLACAAGLIVHHYRQRPR